VTKDPAGKHDYYADTGLSARFYDAITSVDESTRGDTEFYAARIASLNAPGPKLVLELGCGTGRVALQLARIGHSVIGLDLAETMLRQARAKAGRLSADAARRVQFLHQDMLKLDLPLSFHAVISPFYTFNHLATRSERLQCLRVIASHLRPGGEAVIHCIPENRLNVERSRALPRNAITIGFADSERTLQMTWEDRSVDRGRSYVRQVIRYDYLSADGAVLETSRDVLTLFWFTEREMATLVEKAGMRIVAVETSFDADPAGREAIYVLRAAGG